MIDKDTIYRQGAVEALKNAEPLVRDFGYYKVIETIRLLPSAESKRPSEIQDILNYLDTVLHPIISPEHWNVYSELHDMISTLPSASTELDNENGELISRQDVIKYFTELWECIEAISDREEWEDVCATTVNEIKSAESERKTGKWIATYSDCGGDVWVSWKCSNCGYVRKKGWKYTDDGKKPNAIFCEMCNADMREGESNGDK